MAAFILLVRGADAPGHDPLKWTPVDGGTRAGMIEKSRLYVGDDVQVRSLRTDAVVYERVRS